MNAKLITYAPWLVGYAAFLTLIMYGVVQWRTAKLAELERPEVAQEWDEFRTALENEAKNKAPSVHKVPKRDVPSLVIMLRERFPAVLAGAAVFGTLFYGMGVFLIRGIRATPKWQPPADAQEVGP